MSQHVVHAGGGRVGARRAPVLEDDGHDLLVMERDTDRCTGLGERRPGVIVTGDAIGTGLVEQATPGAVSLSSDSGTGTDIETMTDTGSGTELRPSRRYLAAVDPTAAAGRTALVRS